MSQTPTEETTKVETTKVETTTDQRNDGFKSEHSKESVLADLAKERDARQALEAEVAKLKGGQTVLDKLAEVFAKDGEKPKAEQIPDWAAQLVKRLDDADAEKVRTDRAKAIAKDAGVTDVDDIAIIASQTSEDAMKALADRFAKAGQPGTPRPDRSAGRSGGEGSQVASVQAGRDLYRDMHKPQN